MNKNIILTISTIIGIALISFLWMNGKNNNTIAAGKSGDGWYKGKIKIGHLVALDMAPMFLAKSLGYFKEEGLDVETVFFSNPGDNNAALAGKSIQFSINPFTLPYLGNKSGVPMRIISSAGGLSIIQVVAQGKFKVNNLKELKAWKEKNPAKKLKVGTLRGDTLDMILFRGFKNVGLTYDDFEMVWFNDLLAMVQSFKSEQIDILSHIKPYTTDLVINHKANVLTDNSKIWGYGTPNTTVSVLEGFADKYPNTVKAYLKAVKKAFEFMVANPKKAAQTLEEGKYYQTKPGVLEFALQNQPKDVILKPYVKGMMTAINDMVDQNYMKKPKQDIMRLEFLDEIGAK